MLELLKRRSKEAYYSLMEALRTDRPDLFSEIMQIELKFTQDYQENVTDKLIQYPFSDIRREPTLSIHENQDGGQVAILHYYDSQDTRRNPSHSASQESREHQDPEGADVLSNTSENTEIHITIDIHDNTESETSDCPRNELYRTLFMQILRPEYLSNLVNNVFGSLGLLLSRFKTGSLHFYAQCSSIEALEKVGKYVKDGKFAERLSKVLLTEEVIRDRDVSKLKMTTHIDEDDYHHARHILTEIASRPGQPHASYIDSNKITLSWTPPESTNSGGDAVMGYIVEYKEINSSTWIKANTEPVYAHQYTIEGLNWMAAYHFRIFALSTSGQGPASKPSDENRYDIGNWLTERTFGYKTGAGKLKSAYGIALGPNEDIAVADRVASKVQVYDSQGRHNMSLGTKRHEFQISRPHQVVVNHKGTYFLTDRTPYVKLFDAKGERKGQFVSVSPMGKSSDTETDIAGLTGLAMDSKGHLLVGMVGGLTNKYIGKHTQNGKHLSSVPVILSPCYLAVTPDDTIIIGSDFHVAIADHTGRFLRQFRPPDDIQWTTLCGVTRIYGVSCMKDTVFITNCASEHDGGGIHCFSLSGDYLGCAIKGSPRCTAVTNDGNKMVVTSKSCVDIFTRDTSYIC